MTATAETTPTLVARFCTANRLVQEVDVADGRILEWRQGESTPSAPVVELHIPRPIEERDAMVLPFLEYPSLHGAVLVSPGRENVELGRLFPLAIGATLMPELVPRLATLWILHDGPFGRFAWRNVFVGGECVLNDAVDPAALAGTDWDVAIEADFADCVRCFQGELEIRDLMARGHVDGSIGALSALSWHVEREEMAAHAAPYAAQIERVLGWTAAARSDDALAWVSTLT